MLYLLPRAYYNVTVTQDYVIVNSAGDEGIDTLLEVERLLFSDEIMWV